MVKNSKYVNALLGLGAALVWLISAHYFGVATGYFQLARKLGPSVEVLEHIVPIVLAVGFFVFLRKNTVTYNFVTDAVGELVRVSWPETKQVRLGTIVVILTVIIAGIILGAIDIGFSALIKAIIGA